MRTQIIEELSWTEKGLPQKERTKHVHGLHPYLGKFIPQIVDYFLDKYFRAARYAILDPFVGSGTTLVEANVYGKDSIGIDISEFNVLLSQVKTSKYDMKLLRDEIFSIISKTRTYFYSLSKGELDKFIENNSRPKIPRVKSKYLKEWYLPSALHPLLIFRELIPQYKYQDVLQILLTRTARSARLAPHFELDFPQKPQKTDYYCYKHRRICHPTSSSLHFFVRYGNDILTRISSFQKLRTDSKIDIVCGDSRSINFAKYRMSGIITSPPYVGLIDYHDQHRYAYELLELQDRTELEIGPKSKGSSKSAIEQYKSDIAKSLENIANSGLEDPAIIVVVVNDKHNLYEEIAELAGLKISNRLQRKVDRRTGMRVNGFYEDILVFKTRK